MRVLFTIFIFSSLIFANDFQTQSEIESDKIDLAIENYMNCLNHENPGVVESTLANLIRFNYRCPEANLTILKNKLKELSVDQNNELKRKARLVLNILENSELVGQICNQFYNDLEQCLDVMLLSAEMQPVLSAIPKE